MGPREPIRGAFMTGLELEAARKRLRMSAAQLGRALELEGRDPGLTVRRWETGAVAIPGPARVALRYMIAEAREARRVALSEARRVARETRASARQAEVEKIPEPRSPNPVRTRRRG